MKNFKIIDFEGHTEYAWGEPSHLYFVTCSNGNVFMHLTIGQAELVILVYSGDPIPKEGFNEIETLCLSYVLKALNRGDVVIGFFNNPYIAQGIKEIVSKYEE